MQNRFFLYLALLYVSLASISVQGIAIPRDLSPVAGSNLLSRALPANCALRVNTLTGKCGLTSNTRCGPGYCCSSSGFCGKVTNARYCGTGCQSGFGTCTGKASLVCTALASTTSATLVVSTSSSKPATAASVSPTTSTASSSSRTSATSSSSASSVASTAAFCALRINTVGWTCGGTSGNRCFSGSYCSAYGYCSPEFCGVGCQSSFGSCAGFTAPSCTATSATSTVLFTTASATKTVTLTVSSSSAVAIPTGTTSPKFVIYSDLWLPNGSPPPASTLAGFTVFTLSFHLMTGAADMAAGWEWLTNAQRAAVRADYAKAGIKLIVSAFGSTEAPTTAGVNAVFAANRISDWVIKYGLDGVDVDFEDFPAMGNGRAEPWLIAYTRQLRVRLPSSAGYIISHAPIAPWFTDAKGAYPGGGYLAVHRAVGSLIDYYNVQFYNQGTHEYSDCQTLLFRSIAFPHASLFEIAANGVPLNKLIIGKPAIPSDAANGYLAPAKLNVCVAQAKAKGWSGGLMLWQHPHQRGFLSQAWNTGSTASSLLSYCAQPIDVFGGTCGGTTGNRCIDGQACSQYGYCGTGSDFDGAGCQSGFGTCSGNVATSCQ